MTPAQKIQHPELYSSGARLVTPEGRALPLVGAALRADAGGGIARVVLTQRFRNPYAEPLTVTYSLPLPPDGAVSGFSFQIGERRIVGEIDRKKEARERYEQALLEGRSAAILEQDRASLFTQEIGNIPPGAEIVAEVILDQRLRWLDEGAWEWRFPTVVSPRYLGEPGRVPDAARVTQDVSEEPLPARISLVCQIRDALAEGRRPESPSHPIETRLGAESAEVEISKGARLDRDVVVRWAVAAPKVGLSLVTGRLAADRPRADAGYGLLTIVPPSSEAQARPICRDLIGLLDTSGSMGGEPLAQARRVLSALIGTLGERDKLELIEFSSEPRRWKAAPVAATEAARRDALAWLGKLQASGSTEMRTGILEALQAIRPDAQRQVVLVTDGQIGFEAQVIAAICDRLPASARLHTVGVGSAVNRSLTAPAARAGRGIEVVVGLGEDPERAAARLVARTAAPILVELELEGSALLEHAPRRLPDLFAGAPALVSVALRPEGGELRVVGRTAEGRWEQRLRVAPIAAESGSQAAVALFGREAVEDRELKLAAGGDRAEVDAAIERLGLDFQIATRLTSWVAVTEEQTVDPQGALRRERMPHELPHGVSAEGLGLRPAAMAFHEYKAPLGVMRMYAARMDDDEAGRVINLKARLGKSGALAHPGAPKRPALPPFASERPNPSKLEQQEKEQPSQRRQIGGFFAAVGRLFGREQEEAPAKGEGAAPSPGPGQARRLRGRIALQKGGDLVIEVSVDDAGLDWDPGPRAEISLEDGAIAPATVDASRSTRKGSLSAGQLARLTLTLEAGALGAAPRSIAISLGQEQVIIEL